MTILGAEHGFLEVEPHDRADRRADREVVLLLHGLGGSKDDWRFPAWRDYHWDLAHDPPDRHDENNLTPPLDHLPEFGLSPMRTDLRCWSGVLKALGHTVVNYSQDGPQSVVDVPLAQFEQRIVPFLRSDVLTGSLAGKRVIVLCHSRGGILVRAYLHRHPDDGQEWIGRVITLCSPHQGTKAPVAKQKLVDAASALGLPVFGPSVLLVNLVGRIAGWFDETSGAVQLLPDDPLFAELAAPADVPDIEFATLGGTSVRFSRVYSWHYTPGSYVPHWSDFPDLRFDWTEVAIEVPVVSPMLDQLPDFAVDAEQDNGKGDGLVADARARLPGARHERIRVNHGEALWDEALFQRVADLLGTPLSGAAGPVECGRPEIALSFQPSAVSFGTAEVGDTVTRTVRITNTTGVPVIVRLPASPPGVFGWSALNVELPDGESTTASFRFQPTDNAIRTERVRFTSTAVDSPHTVGLVGKGIGGFPVPPTDPLPTRLRYSPPVLSFGSIPIGSTATRTLRIGNDTGRSVRVTIAGSPSGSVFRWSALDTTIATGTERAVTVTFRSASNAIVTGRLVVTSTTAISPETIPLTGKGPGGFPTAPPVNG
jgi:pimeloyl-ACP methyl ester carboxylesterase